MIGTLSSGFDKNSSIKVSATYFLPNSVSSFCLCLPWPREARIVQTRKHVVPKHLSNRKETTRVQRWHRAFSLGVSLKAPVLFIYFSTLGISFASWKSKKTTKLHFMWTLAVCSRRKLQSIYIFYLMTRSESPACLSLTRTVSPSVRVNFAVHLRKGHTAI